MTASLKSLFPHHELAPDRTVSAVKHQDIVVAVSSLLKAERVAIVHMLYPRTDARTHDSLDAMVAKLHNQGLHDVAELISGEAHYLVFPDPRKALTAVRLIRRGSLAIGAQLYFDGTSGEAAMSLLEAHACGGSGDGLRRFRKDSYGRHGSAAALPKTCST